jgi:hypothetical protein
MATHEQAATPGHDGGNEQQQQPQLCRQPVPTSAIASASFFFFNFNFLPALGRHSDGLRQSSRVD